MTPVQFKAWRKTLGLKQKDAADLLGLKKRVIQYYEKGKRDGKNVEIPRTVELACYALSIGVARFDGKTAEPADWGELVEQPEPASDEDDIDEVEPADQAAE